MSAPAGAGAAVRPRRIDQLPSALAGPALDAILEGGPAVFLDYDGTLAPIADRPEDAVLPPATREALAALARWCPVAIVSGRARREVESLVGLEGLAYAGSHGFDIAGPRIAALRHAGAERAVPLLAEVAAALQERLGSVEGVRVENKTYAVAVHYRLVVPEQRDEVVAAVAGQASRHPELRLTGGKMVVEVRPGIDWDKGRAVLWLLGAMKLDRAGVVPVYAGDDETDEDAFAALAGRGVGIAVGDEPRLTRATLGLRDPGEVRAFLGALRERLGHRGSPAG